MSVTASEEDTLIAGDTMQDDISVAATDSTGTVHNPWDEDDSDTQFRLSYRNMVLTESIHYLKLAFANSGYVPASVSKYAFGVLDCATVDEMKPMMFFFDMLNSYGQTIPPLKRAAAGRVFDRLKGAFDGRMPGDPTFSTDGDEESPCWWISVAE